MIITDTTYFINLPHRNAIPKIKHSDNPNPVMALQYTAVNKYAAEQLNVIDCLFDRPSQLSAAVFRYQTIDEIRGRDMNM